MNKDKKYSVYLHTNKINNKRYVGQTCLNIEDRWKNGKGYKHCTYFYNAIQKYGWNNFEHKILLKGLTKDEADLLEKHLIEKWSLNNKLYGYNLKDGGSKGIPSKESTLKQSVTMKNKYKNGEIIHWNKGKRHPEMCGENNYFYGKCLAGDKNGFYGKKHTKESRRKISENNWCKGIESSKHPNAKKIIRLKDNKIYGSVKDCAKDNNINENTIARHCKNKVNKPKFSYVDIKPLTYNI